MSGESVRHRRLVESLIEVMERRHREMPSVVIFADHHRFGAERPPTIGSFTPDVFASDFPATFRVIGEAKTRDDLDTERSHRQLAAFLDHLSLHPPGALWVAVPFVVVPRARHVLRSIRRPEHHAVVVEILPFV